LEERNAHVNLTGNAAFETMLDQHLMDSLAPLTVSGLLPENAVLIDVGSGAGLPGIPLAVVRGDLRITLLDSQQKRVAFLLAAIETLGLANVTAVHARAEDAARDARYRERFDVALARAVAALPALLELLLPFVKTGGKAVCYKGPAVAEELDAGKAAAELLGGGPPDVLAVPVPYLPEQRHCLVVGEKLRRTPDRYPRKAGTPARNPLGT
jgi:16S rRNA (guanine527-N7)-methyltransferase